MKVLDIYKYLDEIAPFSLQEDWDNSGFLVGDMESKVTRVLMALDHSNALIDEAEQLGCELIITHHPIIFDAKKSFTAGNDFFEAARRGIGVLCAHTNFDTAEGGVNDCLCELIGLREVSDFCPDSSPVPVMRQGIIDKIDAEDFAAILSQKLKTSVRFNEINRNIKKVAVCGGSGCMFLTEVLAAGFDAFVTGDAGHHNFLDAKEKNTALFACGHFETERPAIDVLFSKMSSKFKEIEFVISQQKSPTKIIMV